MDEDVDMVMAVDTILIKHITMKVSMLSRINYGVKRIFTVTIRVLWVLVVYVVPVDDTGVVLVMEVVVVVVIIGVEITAKDEEIIGNMVMDMVQ